MKRINAPNMGLMAISTTPTAKRVKTEATKREALLIMNVSRVLTSVIRLDVIAPLPKVSYSFMEATWRCFMSLFLIIKVTCFDIFVKIFVVTTPKA